MGRGLAQMLVYGLFGSVFVPLVGAILWLPSLLVFLGVTFLPTWDAFFFAVPITKVRVPFVDYNSSYSFAWGIIPAFGAVVFALGGALMRPDGDKKFDDIRLLPLFYREVFVWMLRGVMIFGVWGAIFGAISTWRIGDGAVLGLVAARCAAKSWV